MKREQTKIYRDETPSSSDGGLWEVMLFSLLFVVVFSLIARTAHAAPLKAPSTQSQSAQSQSAPTEPAPSAEPDSTPIHPLGDAATIPSDALPGANISTTIAEPANDKSGFASKITVETSQTLSPDDATTYGGWYELSTGYTFAKPNIKLGASLGWFQEYSREKDDHTNGDLDNPVLTASKTWKNDEDFKSKIFDSVKLGVAAVAGTSHESARRTLVASVGPSIGVTKVIRKLHLGQSFSYSHGFYNYDIRDDGIVNSPNVFKSRTDISYDLTEKLALSLSTILSYGITFQNSGATTELSAISLDYSPTERIGLSLGVSTERGTQNADGVSNRIALYAQDVAQGFLDLSLTF